MTGITASQDQPRPKRSRSEVKAEVTDRAARLIIEAEVQRREAKTEKLRQARLEREAREGEAASKAGRGRNRDAST